MNIIKITQDEAFEKLNTPFNPPILKNAEQEHSFTREWDMVRDGLKTVLDTLGCWNAYGEGDYYIGDQVMTSRGLGIELSSDTMMNNNLVPTIQNYLNSLDNDYEVYFSYYDEGSVWNFFISKDTLVTDCSDKVLRRRMKVRANQQGQ